MVDPQTVHRSLAASGAVLVAFIGLSHEFVGASLFPWGPAAFGGPIGWHGVGVSGILAGLLLLAGTLRLVAFPVFSLAAVIAVLGAGIGAYTAVARGQFHFFAFALSLSGVLVAFCHRRAERGPTA